MKNFIVVAAKRSGSTFLQEALTSHDRIKCFDELFFIKSTKTGKRRNQYLYPYMKKNYGYNVNQYIEGIYETKPKKSVGFRLMYPHNEKGKVLDKVDKKTPIIHLIRENKLGKMLSSKTKNIFEVEKIHIDPDQLISGIKQEEKREQGYIKSLEKFENVLTLNYEDIIGRTEGDKGEIKKFGAFNLRSDMYTYIPMEVCEQICNFLDEEVSELYSNVTKKNSYNPGDYIKNDKEIRNILNSEGYEKGIL